MHLGKDCGRERGNIYQNKQYASVMTQDLASKNTFHMVRVVWSGKSLKLPTLPLPGDNKFLCVQQQENIWLLGGWGRAVHTHARPSPASGVAEEPLFTHCMTAAAPAGPGEGAGPRSPGWVGTPAVVTFPTMVPSGCNVFMKHVLDQTPAWDSLAGTQSLPLVQHDKENHEFRV